MTPMVTHIHLSLLLSVFVFMRVVLSCHSVPRSIGAKRAEDSANQRRLFLAMRNAVEDRFGLSNTAQTFEGMFFARLISPPSKVWVSGSVSMTKWPCASVTVSAIGVNVFSLDSPGKAQWAWHKQAHLSPQRKRSI